MIINILQEFMADIADGLIVGDKPVSLVYDADGKVMDYYPNCNDDWKRDPTYIADKPNMKELPLDEAISEIINTNGGIAYKLTEAAQIYGKSVTTLKNLILAGRFDGAVKKEGKQWIIKKSALDEFYQKTKIDKTDRFH